uniref:RCC1-like domain-containing protein n=1 Tax=Palpitomonas bilix TaxID=652834 RepID=A0A7S3GG91_9EUKA|mmetsp:Transcript_47913/g.124408  ORF Transcript_47913/g.124408 Transcript_47913/m.124408 type:complete len:462 (+) Transcript_47913:249-1634(+)
MGGAAGKQGGTFVQAGVDFHPLSEGEALECKAAANLNDPVDSVLFVWGGKINGIGLYGHIPRQCYAGKVKQVACGGEFMLILTDGGSVSAMGLNNMYQLGNGTTHSNYDVPKVLLGLRTKNVSRIAAGKSFAAAACNDEFAVYCWGGVAADKQAFGMEPTSVKLPDVRSTVLDLQCGDSQAVALLMNGQVMVWGDNTHGELGRGNLDSYSEDFKHAAFVDITPKEVVSVAVGGHHCAAVSCLGEVYTWGGTSGAPACFGMKPRKYVRGGVRSIKCGPEHVLALTRTGRVLSWGFSSMHQTGHRHQKPVAAPMFISALVGEFVEEISTNKFTGGTDVSFATSPMVGHVCLAVTDKGSAFAWGGVGGKESFFGASPQKCTVEDRRGVASHIEVEPEYCLSGACGVTHICVKTRNNKVASWGIGNFQQVGDGRQKNQRTPQVVLWPDDGPRSYTNLNIEAVSDV